MSIGPTLAKKTRCKNPYGMVYEVERDFKVLWQYRMTKIPKLTYIDWIVTAPHNNKQLTGTKSLKVSGILL